MCRKEESHCDEAGKTFPDVTLKLLLTSRTTSSPSVQTKVSGELPQDSLENTARFQPGSCKVSSRMNNLLDNIHINDPQTSHVRKLEGKFNDSLAKTKRLSSGIAGRGKMCHDRREC